MQLLSCHNGQLHTDKISMWSGVKTRSFTTGLAPLDELLRNGVFARGAVHELLTLPTHPSPFFVALFLARTSAIQKNMGHESTRIQHESTRIFQNQLREDSCSIRVDSCPFSGAIVWCDPEAKLYPPAVAALGVPLDKLFLLRPKTIADENWAIAECLRCRGVSAVVAAPRRLSRIEARRFQLAAERGGGIGILLRRYDKLAGIYSAATRWLVAPTRGERTVQKWKLQLIHAHGGRIGQTILLEHYRETNSIQAHSLREAQQLADRPVQKTGGARAANRATA